MLNKIGLWSGLVGLAVLGGSASAAPASFNGTWGIELVTDQGSCDGHYDYSVQVHNGAAQLAGPDAASATLTGGVGNNGDVTLTLTRSMATANALGHLKGNRGSGTWHVDFLGCSGRWTAARRA